MAANDCGHRVIGPHIPFVAFGEIAKFLRILLIGTSVRQMTTGATPRRIHGQRYIASFRPMLGPLSKGFSTSAMNQNHSREWTTAGGRTPKVSKHARRFSVVELPLIIHLLYQPGASTPISARRL